MKHYNFLLFLFILLLISSCGKSTIKTYDVTLYFEFEQDRSCEYYLADEYTITILDRHKKQIKQKQLPCSQDSNSTTINLERGTYYISADLTAGNNIKSHAMNTITIPTDSQTTFSMRPYSGGLTITWNDPICNDYDINRLSYSIEHNNAPLEVSYWTETTTFTDFEIPCSDEKIMLHNIEEGSYEMIVKGYRDVDPGYPRAASETISFAISPGQHSTFQLTKDKLLLNVSDLHINWEFDSRSIESCSDASVSNIKVVIKDNDSDISFSQTEPCNNSDKKFSFYNIKPGVFTITVSGIDQNGTTTFSGIREDYTIEKGFVGNDAYDVKIFLKEL